MQRRTTHVVGILVPLALGATHGHITEILLAFSHDLLIPGVLGWAERKDGFDVAPPLGRFRTFSLSLVIGSIYDARLLLLLSIFPDS